VETMAGAIELERPYFLYENKKSANGSNDLKMLAVVKFLYSWCETNNWLCQANIGHVICALEGFSS
jgi:hypothetical protein